MRAVAACSILIWHSWLYSSPSRTPVHLSQLSAVLPDLQFGVTLFFALSGFLLYRPFAATVLRDRRPLRTSAYLRNRALRILPCYWFILLVAGLLLGTVLVRESGRLVPGHLNSVGDVLRTGAFVQNYTPETLGMGIGPGWSLAVEVVFYLSLPLLALLGYAFGRRAATVRGRRLAVLLPPGLLLCFGLSGKVVAAKVLPGPSSQWGTTWHSVVELSFWGMADLFAFGMALAVLYVEVEDGRVRLTRWWRPATATAALGAYTVVALSTHWGDQLSYKPANTLMAAACAFLLALVVLPTAARERQPLLLRLLETRPFVAVGIISYSVFLWHVPIVYWLQRNGLVVAGLRGFFLNTLVLFATTFALSALTYRYIEAPALRFKGGRARTAGQPAPVPAHQESAAP